MTRSVQKIAASSAILLTENIVRLATVAAVSFWIARELGPAKFGILNFASALMAILLAAAEMGMEVPVTLRLIDSPAPGQLMGTVLALRSGFSILIFMIGAVLAAGLKHADGPAVTASIIVDLCILGYIANALDFWFKARTSAAAPALARTAATLLAGLVKAVCLVFGLGLIALAWTIVLESVLAAFGLCWAYRASAVSSVDRLSFNPMLLRPLVRESLPYFFSSVAVLLFMKIDVVMMGFLSSNLQTGIYGLAQKLSEVVYVVPVVLVASAYPSLARQFLAGGEGGRESAQMLFDLAVGSSIVAVVLANMLARPVIQRLFGPAYQPAVQIFYLHSWSCIAIAMHEARHRWLAAVSLQRYAPTVTAIGLAVNLVMNVALIPLYGALGAAVTTVVSYFVSGYLSSFFIKPLRGFGVAQTRALWPWGRLYRAARIWQQNGLPA